MGGCQNYGPLLGTPNITCRIIIGTQKGTIILTTTHMFILSDRLGMTQAACQRFRDMAHSRGLREGEMLSPSIPL